MEKIDGHRPGLNTPVPDAKQATDHRLNQTSSQKLRPSDASALCGISKSTLQRWEKEWPDFPKPSRPTPRVTLYDRDKLLAFIDKVGRQEPAA